MFILAFDATAAACSVALVRDGLALAADRVAMDRGQAEALLPLIEDVMNRAGAAYTDLDRIAVTAGPGSFTGVRVGLAAARGLGLAAGKTVVGVSSLETLAAAATAEAAKVGCSRILAAIDTKRGDIYGQIFDTDARPLNDPAALAPAAIDAWCGDGPVLVTGDGSAVAAAALGRRAVQSRSDPLPDAAVVARLAEASDAPALPLYILPPKVTLAPGTAPPRSAGAES